jgi:hypothetical protein
VHIKPADLSTAFTHTSGSTIHLISSLQGLQACLHRRLSFVSLTCFEHSHYNCAEYAVFELMLSNSGLSTPTCDHTNDTMRKLHQKHSRAGVCPFLLQLELHFIVWTAYGAGACATLHTFFHGEVSKAMDCSSTECHCKWHALATRLRSR